jgi:hypothetical protein
MKVQGSAGKLRKGEYFSVRTWTNTLLLFHRTAWTCPRYWPDPRPEPSAEVTLRRVNLKRKRWLGELQAGEGGIGRQAAKAGVVQQIVGDAEAQPNAGLSIAERVLGQSGPRAEEPACIILTVKRLGPM